MTATATSLAPHPYADQFPMLPDAELADLAESIRENGLRQPIVVTTDGLILDGRNRYAACEMAGVEAVTVVYDGDDLAEYVIDCNVTRRNMSTGARAMATALVLAADGRREGGRWARDSIGPGSDSPEAFAKAVQRAGVVLDWLPDVAEQVVSGVTPLKAAYVDACTKRDAVDAEKRAKAIEANRKREETIREREANDRMLAALTEWRSKYLASVESGDMSIKAAHAAHLADTEKERERERQLDRGRHAAVRGVSECVRHIEGGTKYAEVFLRDFYPHEQRFLTDREWLTRAKVQAAIDFLTAIQKGIRA